MKLFRMFLIIIIILLKSISLSAQNNVTINFSIGTRQNNIDSMTVSCENLVTNNIFKVKGKKKSINVYNEINMYMSYEIIFLLQSKYRITFSKPGCSDETFYLNTTMPKSEEGSYSLHYISNLNTSRDSITGFLNAPQSVYCWYVISKKSFDPEFDPILINEMLYNVGVEKSEKNEYEVAIIDFTEALKFIPNDVNSLYNRGVIKLKLKDKIGACEDWNTIKSNGHPDADALLIKYCN